MGWYNEQSFNQGVKDYTGRQDRMFEKKMQELDMQNQQNDAQVQSVREYQKNADDMIKRLSEMAKGATGEGTKTAVKRMASVIAEVLAPEGQKNGLFPLVQGQINTIIAGLDQAPIAPKQAAPQGQPPAQKEPVINQEPARKANAAAVMAPAAPLPQDNQIAETPIVAPDPAKLTAGEKVQDREFAKEATKYKTLGGFTTVEKGLKRLKDARKNLAEGGVSGPLTGITPDSLKPFTNPKAVDTQEAVAEVAQGNLREVLGGQFAQKEGEQLIMRAYNPSLDEKQNINRLDALIKQIEDAADEKKQAIEYFDKYGTVKGFKKTPKPTDEDPLGIFQ